MFQRKPRNGKSLQRWTKPKWNQSETAVEQSNADSDVALPESVFKFIGTLGISVLLLLWKFQFGLTLVRFKNWLCTNQLTDRPTSAGKRWNELACKPERGRARSLQEIADETHQGEIKDMLVCKRLSFDTWNHLWLYSTGMLGKDRPYRPVWAWLLHHWGFGWAPSAWGWVKTWQKWWGWGTEKENGEMDDGRSFHPSCQGPLLVIKPTWPATWRKSKGANKGRHQALLATGARLLLE